MAAGLGASRGVRFALAKFRPTTLPTTLIDRPALHDRLTAGVSQRLTVVVGSAGSGKSVLLSSWAAARPAGTTAWLSCDRGDANPVRFWTAFIEAPRAIDPGFGADAADLLAMDGVMSADVIASIANDAARLPAGTAVIVDDFHTAAPAVSGDMTDLVERWPAQTVQLVLVGRSDPQLRLHRLRMAGELCELRDRDLYFSLAESGALLANFDVQVGAGELALLHRSSEGWAAALQMAALSLRGTPDPARAARALDVRGHAIAEYFISEVLQSQSAEVTQFMLDTSVLGELTAEACTAVTLRPDAAALLRAELRARDRDHEQAVQLRAGEWFESAGDMRRAARHYLAAQQPERALALLQDRVVPDFLRNPALPAPLDLSTVDPSLLATSPDQLLSLATDLLLSGDPGRGGEYLDLLERAQPSIPPESALAAQYATMRAFHYAVTGHLDQAVATALTARAIQERLQLTDEWTATISVILLSVYPCLEDYKAAEGEATAALALPGLTEPARLVLVPGARAMAWFQSGLLAEAAEAAGAAAADARRLGFSRHFFAVDYLRVQAGLALERRDLETAEKLTELTLSITERRRPTLEFLALLDRAGIWAARGQFREALATVKTARLVLAGTKSVLLAQADELEAQLRLSLGDLASAAELAGRLRGARRSLLEARIALADGDHEAAARHLQAPSLDDLTPRRALERQVLLAAVAVERGDPMAAGIVGGVLHAARHGSFVNTVVTTAPQVTGYLIEHWAQVRPDPLMEQLIAAAMQVRATQPNGSRPGRTLAEPLTAAELRILKLLPTSTYLQMAATLYISRNTVKTHLRSVYQKLGVASRSEAIERAVDLRLI